MADWSRQCLLAGTLSSFMPLSSSLWPETYIFLVGRTSLRQVKSKTVLGKRISQAMAMGRRAAASTGCGGKPKGKGCVSSEGLSDTWRLHQPLWTSGWSMGLIAACQVDNLATLVGTGDQWASGDILRCEVDECRLLAGRDSTRGSALVSGRGHGGVQRNTRVVSGRFSRQLVWDGRGRTDADVIVSTRNLAGWRSWENRFLGRSWRASVALVRLAPVPVLCGPLSRTIGGNGEGWKESCVSGTIGVCSG